MCNFWFVLEHEYNVTYVGTKFLAFQYLVFVVNIKTTFRIFASEHRRQEVHKEANQNPSTGFIVAYVEGLVILLLSPEKKFHLVLVGAPLVEEL